MICLLPVNCPVEYFPTLTLFLKLYCTCRRKQFAFEKSGQYALKALTTETVPKYISNFSHVHRCQRITQCSANLGAAIAQSVQRLATGWTVQGSNPGGGARFSAPVQTGHGANPMGTGSFTGVKRPARGADRPPPSSAEVEERVQLYLYSTPGPSWPAIG